MKSISNQNNSLVNEIKQLIIEAKQHAASTVNAAITILYWNIGDRINNEVLKSERAEYGNEVIKELSKVLTGEYGKGWSDKQLRHCLRFAEVFPEVQIVYTLCRQLSWSHLRVLSYIKNDLERNFYLEMCKLENWTVRVLNSKIDSMLFERTAISKKTEIDIKNDLAKLKDDNKLTPDLVFKDPYILNFLGLEDNFSENNLEDAILKEMEKFILELGQGFTFVERQKRMLIDGESFKLDLLFYHRKLKRLVAIDLKLGRFKAAYKGQMELYLRYLEKYEMEENEEPPLGLLLCTEGNQEQIELLQLEKYGIRVAEYLMELPSKAILKRKLNKAIEEHKERLERKKLLD